MDSGFQGQFLNPKVLNKALLHSNNTNIPSSQRYALPFFQNRSHESDAKFHLPWNKLCDSRTLPGIFFCLYSTWTRKIPIPITNYWTDGLKNVPLTPLSFALGYDFPYSKAGSLQHFDNAGTQKASSNLPSLYWERTFPCLHFQSYHNSPCSYLWYMIRIITLQSLYLFKVSPLALHSRDDIAALKCTSDHFTTTLKNFGGFCCFWTNRNKAPKPKEKSIRFLIIIVN